LLIKATFSGSLEWPLYIQVWLHFSWFIPGALDDWKNYFTLQQNEDFEQRYEKEMGGFKLKLKSMLTPGSLETGCVEVAQCGPKL